MAVEDDDRCNDVPNQSRDHDVTNDVTVTLSYI